MKSRDFVYWLQGFFEIEESDKTEDAPEISLSPQKVAMLRKHLNMVFKHEIDPSMGDAEHQESLNTIHNPNQGGFGLDGNMRC